VRYRWTISLDYLVIGHVTEDLTPEGLRLGGTVAYAGLTAHALGLGVGIVTAAADACELSTLREVAVHRVCSEETTRFENRYADDGERRTQFLRGRAAPLSIEAIPVEWREASIVHLAPVASELDPAMATSFAHPRLALTPQGWMRSWDAGGLVSRANWSRADRSLSVAWATVVSLEDVGGDWALVERWGKDANALAVTQGALGATVFWGGRRRSFRAPEVEVVDPTGAGDVFAGCFFTRFYQTGDAWDAARQAVLCASESVTAAGMTGISRRRA